MTQHWTDEQILSLVVMCHKAREQEAHETESRFIDSLVGKVTQLVYDCAEMIVHVKS